MSARDSSVAIGCLRLLILIASIQTLVAEAGGAACRAAGAAEIAGALLLLVPRTQWLGLTLLLGCSRAPR